MNERLPPHQLAIKKKAEKYGLINTIKKIGVKIFRERGEKISSVVINSLKAIEDNQNVAIKKLQPKNQDNFCTPGGEKESKRPQSSPGEAFGIGKSKKKYRYQPMKRK